MKWSRWVRSQSHPASGPATTSTRCAVCSSSKAATEVATFNDKNYLFVTFCLKVTLIFKNEVYIYYLYNWNIINFYIYLYIILFHHCGFFSPTNLTPPGGMMPAIIIIKTSLFKNKLLTKMSFARRHQLPFVNSLGASYITNHSVYCLDWNTNEIAYIFEFIKPKKCYWNFEY